MATKLKKLDISGTTVKKKKKLVLPEKVSKSKALVIAEQPPKKRISKLNTKGMRSIIGDSAEEIQQLLEVNTDNATLLMQKRMMQTLVDMLPYAEHNIRESKGSRGVYQINSLITSLRELMIDAQAVKDKGALGDAMVEKIIRPTFLDLGMQLVLEDERMLKEIKDTVGINEYRAIKVIHQASLTRLAQTIQDKYAEAKQQSIAFLQQ